MPQNDDLTKFSATPITITVDGQTYTLSPLTLADRARWQGFIKSKRLDAVYEMANRRPVPDELVCESLARAASQPVSMAHMLADDDSMMLALSLSLSKTDRTMTVERISAIPAKLTRQLVRIMLENEGIIRKATDDEEGGTGDEVGNPTEPSPSAP